MVLLVLCFTANTFLVSLSITYILLKFKLLEEKMGHSGDFNPAGGPIHPDQKIETFLFGRLNRLRVSRSALIGI